MALVPVVCNHGPKPVRLKGIRAAQEGTVVYSPECADSRGGMRPHPVVAKP